MSQPQPDSQQYLPGQVGSRHLLGVMAVVSVVAALSAAQLRTLAAARLGEVILHWVLVAVVGGITYYLRTSRRRKDRAAAGPLVLQVLCKAVSPTRRRIVSWLLLAAVVADGVFMSVMVLPTGFFGKLLRSPSGLLWIIFGQGALWGYCLDHWRVNVYLVEFRQHGILTYQKYFPWDSIVRITWSPAEPTTLVISSGKMIEYLSINPSDCPAVRELLAQRAALADDSATLTARPPG